ncbi:MAG TPA: hypothetical protein VFV50_14720 [Bdellovibrionales bacterium]|nr:hypothetical protein [Bdellovibrionales bacterium]
MRLVSMLVAALFVFVTATGFAGEGTKKQKKSAKAKVTKAVKKQAKAAKAQKKADKKAAKAKAKPKPKAEPPPAPEEANQEPQRDVASETGDAPEAADAGDLGAPEDQPDGPGADEVVDGDAGEIED